jgi:predicted nuclease of restriction endonuclease-like RecB superfamily
MIIDLFRNKEILEDKNPYLREIDSSEVYDYVMSHIEFHLTKKTWKYIDRIFSDQWNSKIGLGGCFYWDVLEEEVLLEFKKHRILIPDNEVRTIAHLILEYIEKVQGTIE